MNAALMLTIVSYHKYMNKVSETTVNSHDNNRNGFNFHLRTITPPEFHLTQPRATQVWNYDEIGFDPNCKWHKVVYTYKFFQGEIMCKIQTRERAPFLCTLLVFTRSYGKCFMPPIVVHQAKE